MYSNEKRVHFFQNRILCMYVSCVEASTKAFSSSSSVDRYTPTPKKLRRPLFYFLDGYKKARD